MTFAERVSHALAKVPHDADCVAFGSAPTDWMGPRCMCDREARIAALVATALPAVMWCAATHRHQPDLEAFVRFVEEANP